MDTDDPAGMRRSYRRGSLTEDAVAPTWHQQLRAWFDEAVEHSASPEPNALQVATVDADGHPSLRTVLAKGVDQRGVTFFTNYDSAKGRDLAARPYAAAQFLWLDLERQVRLSGPVHRVAAEETERYFHSRPRGSQLGAWASPQSQVVSSRAVLDERLAEVTARFDGGDVPVPPHWGGLRLEPDAVEFWQGRPDRLHDRLRFRLGAGSPGAWSVERLAP